LIWPAGRKTGGLFLISVASLHPLEILRIIKRLYALDAGRSARVVGLAAILRDRRICRWAPHC
jgi:hypothetical protein